MTTSSKRLLVVSHTPHHQGAAGVVGWGATVREIDHLAREFGQVHHIAVLHSGPAPASAIRHESPGVTLIPVRPAGGKGLLAKLGILTAVPAFVRLVLAQLRWADVIHVRAPANLSLVAMFLLAFVRNPRVRWVKYAGNWKRYEGEPLSYKLQRWWLRRGFARSLVTVNGTWAGDPSHVRPFRNPCLTEDELRVGRITAGQKKLEDPMVLLFVGRLEEAKGSTRAVEILRRLRAEGIDARLELVGDGPLRARLEAMARAGDLAEVLTLHGWLPRSEINAIYARAHFLLLPSTCSEGWPKVLSEGMAFGAVPVASSISSIPQVLREFETGRSLPAQDTAAFVAAIIQYAERPELWDTHSRNALRAAEHFTYTEYVAAVKSMLSMADSGAPPALDRKGNQRARKSSRRRAAT
jgi:glycosyltransferase involved in cell wall biosynthesis